MHVDMLWHAAVQVSSGNAKIPEKAETEEVVEPLEKKDFPCPAGLDVASPNTKALPGSSQPTIRPAETMSSNACALPSEDKPKNCGSEGRKDTQGPSFEKKAKIRIVIKQELAEDGRKGRMAHQKPLWLVLFLIVLVCCCCFLDFLAY